MLPTGLWKRPISTNPAIQRLYSIYSVLIQIVYVSYNISMVIRLVEMFSEYEMDILYTYITLLILILEINYKVLLYLKNKVPYMFFTVIEREEKILDSGEDDVKSIYFKQIKYFKVATFCQCFCSGFGISWFTFIHCYNKYARGIQEHFMYELWFPFNKENNDNIITAYKVLMAIYGFFFNCAVQTPLQTLMVFSTSQLRILQFKLRNAFAEKFISEQKKVEYIKELIKDHQFLIKFIDTLNVAVRNIILLEFALESINGAGALLQIVSIKDPTEIPYSLLYLSVLVINLGAITWSANEIIVQSCEIGNAVYECNWMDQSEPTKKLLHIMILRAQKPLSIDVGPFRHMDTQAALMTLKGSYTYASMMLQTRQRTE